VEVLRLKGAKLCHTYIETYII